MTVRRRKLERWIESRCALFGPLFQHHSHIDEARLRLDAKPRLIEWVFLKAVAA